MKKRLDLLMVERALAPSREKAKAYIMSGDVYVDGQKEDKAGTMFKETVKIGGLKLEKAMNNFGVSLDGKVCMDVGASTGGFTDCMLQNGAVKVYSIDVGYGQLDWKLRNDPRVCIHACIKCLLPVLFKSIRCHGYDRNSSSGIPKPVPTTLLSVLVCSLENSSKICGR